MENNAFYWCTGIEDTFITKPGSNTGKTLDEYELTNHYKLWEKDLSNIASLGVNTVRWGIPWYKVNPSEKKYDWSWTDKVFEYLDKIALSPIVDFVHYGVPDWIEGSFLNPDYPSFVEEYVYEVMKRYQSQIHMATPCNEPFTAAQWSSSLDDWPPAVFGDRGFVGVLLGAAHGAAKTSKILQSFGATTVHIEVSRNVFATTPTTLQGAEFESYKHLLYWDFLTGKVNESHPLYTWLLQNGASDALIATIADLHAPIDIMGINYYPQWSDIEITEEGDGQFKEQIAVGGKENLLKIIQEQYARYNIPVMITETSWKGLPEEKIAWLQRSTEALRDAQASNIEIVGYTWFPALEMVDWKYRSNQGEPDQYRLNLGFWDLNRVENPAAEMYRSIIRMWS
jgi:beta-glucosidase/6-phospho-beta-glucosidase/beta-galactosidase